jgi:hypothetical protein
VRRAQSAAYERLRDERARASPTCRAGMSRAAAIDVAAATVDGDTSGSTAADDIAVYTDTNGWTLDAPSGGRNSDGQDGAAPAGAAVAGLAVAAVAMGVVADVLGVSDGCGLERCRVLRGWMGRRSATAGPRGRI